MKFRFCGELDAPDWILAEVSTLSKMSSVRLKLICRQVLNQLLGRGFSYEKVKTLILGVENLRFNLADVKAMIAALHFILANSAKYSVDVEVLQVELQQLGLPNDSCRAVTKVYGPSKNDLRAYFASQILQLDRVVKADWRVDYVLSSSIISAVKAPSIRMNLRLKTKSTQSGEQHVAFEVAPDKFRVLLADLRAARKMMDTVA